MSQPLSIQDRRLLNEFQHHFPLSPHPYADLAERLGTSEEEVLGQIKRLQGDGLISRVGAVIQPHTIGYSTLAAMSIPTDKIEDVVELINQLPQVNHNYERENKMNIWFVVTAEDENSLNLILQRIERETGYQVHSFPMVKDFHIDLGFKLDWKHPFSIQSGSVHPAAFS
ncbi:MAG: Lrp/AsnC family transcriptional regulator [Gammaproteobacteria bacterium]|uniref:siroheme decarboxylase n=1 Tax=Candidatus Thiopontia autotrophica TaxID=2841688 RepID=A0A8J6P7R7_9GAMM|nr:Lrp/AsnC family transcriptional regulator [Candidatus Thiopontia autotrophica]